MKIMICIGSSCHIRGSYNVVNKLKEIISSDTTIESVDLCGSFCMNECGKGVCIKIDDTKYIVDENNVLETLKKHSN